MHIYIYIYIWGQTITIDYRATDRAQLDHGPKRITDYGPQLKTTPKHGLKTRTPHHQNIIMSVRASVRVCACVRVRA